METTVVVLIAHGSRHPAAATEHDALCRLVAERSGLDVRPAYLELSEPSIPEAIDAAVAGGARRVRLMPYFLHPGHHVRRDLPEIAAAARARHPGVAVVLEPHVGDDPGLVDLLVRRLSDPRPA